MEKKIFAIIAILVFALTVITPPILTSGSFFYSPPTADISVNQLLTDQGDQIQVHIESNEDLDSFLSENDDSIRSPSNVDSIYTSADSDLLFPTQMDPITSCLSALGGPFGEDVEIFMGGDIGNRIELIPEWKTVQTITGSSSSSNVAAAAASTENIVAAWKNSNDDKIWFDLWRSSETTPEGDWEGSINLDFQADGDPIIIVKSEFQWEIFARRGDSIYMTVLTDTVSIDMIRAPASPWVQLPGVNNAASDPVVLPVSPNHTGVFYLDDSGQVWFTEWTGGWAWRDKPLALVDNWRIALPLVIMSPTTTKGNSEASTAPSSAAGILSEPQEFQALTAVSRHEKHMAVFAVDQKNQLWVREWTRSNTDDWSNTHWVKLMGGVALEKPAVASRHINHIGVALRDTSGNPQYLDWTNTTGWTAPISLPAPPGAVLKSPLTLAAVATDAYWVFGADQNGVIQELSWDEDNGWGAWGSIGTGMAPDQTLAVPVRRFMDLMVLGRSAGGEVNNIHFTSQGGAVTSTAMRPARSSAYIPRGQVLAWVDGRVLQVAGRQSGVGPPYFWEVDAYEMAETDPLTGTLLLDNHLFMDDNLISLAAGDLDHDGSDEVVVATRSGLSQYDNNTTLSVLDIGLDSSLLISRIAQTNVLTDTFDISVKIGDLDGNGQQDEIVLVSTERMGVDGYVYRYDPENHQIVKTYEGQLISTPFEYYHELEIALGRFYPPDPYNADPGQRYLGDQLAVLDTIRDYNHNLDSEVSTFSLITDTWNLASVNTFGLGSQACPEPCTSYYRSTADSGDLDGDGFDEIAAWYGNIISIIDPLSKQIETETYDPIHDPNNGQSLSVGDIDLDGHAEILAGSQQYLSIYEILGDDHMVRTQWQQWDPSWGTATATLAGDLDQDTFISDLVGCKTFQEARIAVVINGAPRWYENDVPIQKSSGSYSVSEGGEFSSETGTSHSWGNSLSIGFDQSFGCPFTGLTMASFRASITSEFMKTTTQFRAREAESIYGTNYIFDNTSLGLVILNVRSYTCNFYDLYPPSQPEYTSRAMACTRQQHEKEFQSLDWWLTSGRHGDFEHSWADVGHRSPGGLHTNNLDEPRNYASSLPVDYRVVYSWVGADIPKICGDPEPAKVEWWAEDAQGYSKGREVTVEENTTVSAGATIYGLSTDTSSTTGQGSRWSESLGWFQQVGFSAGVTQFDTDLYIDEDYRCYKIVPYVHQTWAQTLGGFTYPYLELDYYVPWVAPPTQK